MEQKEAATIKKYAGNHFKFEDAFKHDRTAVD